MQKNCQKAAEPGEKAKKDQKQDQSSSKSNSSVKESVANTKGNFEKTTKDKLVILSDNLNVSGQYLINAMLN